MNGTTPFNYGIDPTELCNRNNPVRIGGDVETIDDIIAFLSEAGIEISTAPGGKWNA